MKLTAVYPGTFDPITNGHLDILSRGGRMFDRIIVAILRNPEKDPLFPLDERVEILKAAVSRWSSVSVESFDGLLVDFARARGAQVIVRGLRALSDFEYEFQMTLMNQRLEPGIQTVFMMPSEAYSYVSSRLVKEVARLGGDVSGLVPPDVVSRLKRRFAAVART
ncbi:MAG: pantetheine-phosphate adenylyltransferase [Acidobacteria bacterium 13_1_40CM_2_68_10]|nr:MAG: pantetheine-phosphate adenylyltransferase [Acidobacteria bacterium 13_1_40CM_2_68_10]OLE65705.1 MAG: pantetheine-phosphate adenylyltransferase [Acidobacteria bacterium 13_1_20CM_2_68_14]